MLKINEIYCGNNLDILKEIDDNSIDIIITSPPYNFDMEYDVYQDNLEIDKYMNFLNKVWKESFRILKDGGRLCVNLMPMYKQYYPTHHFVTKQVIDLGFLWKTEIIWDKKNYNCGFTNWGSWKSPSMPYLKSTWEYINIYYKGNQKKEGNREDIDITTDEFVKWTNIHWKIAPEKGNKEFNHPAMFPEEIVIRLLKLFSYKEDLVLDPFNGIGTATKIAKLLDRNFIGIDLSEKYCKIAKERLVNSFKEDMFE